MSKKCHPSLDKLPIELLHYICNYLDAKTILLSLRETCRRLRSAINNYDRDILDFNLINEIQLRRICHSINPGKIQSLTLSHTAEEFNKMRLFNSMFPAKQFSQIRFLTLIAIKESQLRDILKHVNVSSLVSFSLDVVGSNDEQLTTTSTSTFLSSMLIRSKLSKLILNIPSNRLKGIEWFEKYTIEYLQIEKCLHFNEMNRIFHRMPQLRTLIIGSCPIQNIHQINLIPYEQLTTLVFKNIETKINDLEVVLRLMPSLTRLKLIGNGNFFDGYRWEKFIRKNLSLLNKLEFYFKEIRSDQLNDLDIERIMESFQTEFWLKEKKWFVTCQYNLISPNQIKLYSVPKCIPELKSNDETAKISVSTVITSYDQIASIMVNPIGILFNFSKITPNDIEQKGKGGSHLLLHKRENLILVFNSNRPVSWIPFVSMFIDWTTVTNIRLGGVVIFQGNPDIVADVANLLKKTSNVFLLAIRKRNLIVKSCLTANDICLMTPNHVKHLQVSIKNLNEAINVLQQIDHLLAVEYFFDDVPTWDQFHQWFKMKNQRILYRIEQRSLHVRFLKNTIQSNQMTLPNKRIKLDDHHHP